MANLFSPGIPRVVDELGHPVPGAKVYFYLTGTLTPAPIYTTAAGDTPLTNPVVADSSGILPNIYLDHATTYRVRWFKGDGSSLRPDIDPLRGFDEVDAPTGPQGVKGDTGDTGANSTVPGPQGPAGIPGSTVVGAGGFALTDINNNNFLLVTPSELRHPVINSNTRRVSKALRGPADPTLADMRAISERIGIHGTGESLSVGSSGTPLLSTIASTYSDMFNGGIAADSAANITGASDPNLVNHRASLTSAYEQAHTGATFVAGYETPMSGIAQMIVQLLRDEDGIDIATSGMKFLLTADGRVGSGIGAEVNGVGTWTAERFNASITQAASLYNTAGKAYLPAANTLLIGTNDNYNDAANYPTPTAKYFYNIAVTLQAQRQALAQAAVGGTRRLPMLIGQTATHVQVPISRPNVALDQVQLAIDKQEFILAVIQYAILYPNVDVHPGGYGYKHAGAYLGLALKRLLFDGFRVAPLIPTFKAQGSKIIATFPVRPGHKLVSVIPPSGSLLSNWGVTATTAGGTAKTLSNPRIVGTDTIVWDAPSVPADAWKFQCGFTGNSTIGFTNIAEQPIDGPIIFDPDYLKLPLYRWLPIYEGVLS